jgi:tagatose 1,6-diphosphate aldolase
MAAPATIEAFPVPPADLSCDQVRLRFVSVVPGDPSRGLVPFYHFRILTAEGQDAGHINFKVGDTDHVRFCVGHIGFAVSEAFRGRGLAYQACRAIAPFVRSIYTTAIITSDPDNHASIRTIERLGASFVDEVDVPLHDPQYQRGSRRKKRYHWTP